jgi:hypothetical protein
VSVDRRDTIRQVSAPNLGSPEPGPPTLDRLAIPRPSAPCPAASAARPDPSSSDPAAGSMSVLTSASAFAPRSAASGPAARRRGHRAGKASPLFPARSFAARSLAPHPTPSNSRVAGDPDSVPSAGPASGPHAVELAGLLHELSSRLLSADDVPQALERLAAFAVRAVPGAQRCSVALIGENAPLTVAGADISGQTPAEDSQYTLGSGPGLDAARTRALVTSHDLANDARWPDLSGDVGVVAVPLDVDRASVGALCVYLVRPNAVNPDVLLTAMAIANQAEIMLSEVHRRAHRTAGAAVDRAAGVIIAQRGCGVREAYDVLDDTANRLGLDRRAVAKRLIAAAARTDRTPTPS